MEEWRGNVPAARKGKEMMCQSDRQVKKAAHFSGGEHIMSRRGYRYRESQSSDFIHRWWCVCVCGVTMDITPVFFSLSVKAQIVGWLGQVYVCPVQSSSVDDQHKYVHLKVEIPKGIRRSTRLPECLSALEVASINRTRTCCTNQCTQQVHSWRQIS